MSQLRTAWKPGERPSDGAARAKAIIKEILPQITIDVSQTINTKSGKRHGQVSAISTGLCIWFFWTAATSETQSHTQDNAAIIGIISFCVAFYALIIWASDLVDYQKLKHQIADALAAEEEMQKQNPHGAARFATTDDLRRSGFID